MWVILALSRTQALLEIELEDLLFIDDSTKGTKEQFKESLAPWVLIAWVFSFLMAFFQRIRSSKSLTLSILDKHQSFHGIILAFSILEYEFLRDFCTSPLLQWLRILKYLYFVISRTLFNFRIPFPETIYASLKIQKRTQTFKDVFQVLNLFLERNSTLHYSE